MAKLNPQLLLKLMVEFGDVVRYSLLTIIAHVLLTGLLILNILFVIPPAFDVDLMALLHVTHPDDIAPAVIEASARIALYAIIVFWASYIPRMIMRSQQTPSKGAIDER